MTTKNKQANGSQFNPDFQSSLGEGEAGVSINSYYSRTLLLKSLLFLADFIKNWAHFMYKKKNLNLTKYINWSQISWANNVPNIPI